MRRYRNFDVELFDHTQTGSQDVFRVRVADSDVGEQRISHADRVELPLEVRGVVARLRRRELRRAEMITLGGQLGSALLPDGVRRLWSAALARLGDDEGLRLRVRCDTYGLAELPWEYAHLMPPDLAGERPGPEGFLVLNRRISLVRYEPQEGPQVSLDAGVSPIRLVALLASPADPRFDPLDLGTERRSIEQAVGDLAAVRAEFVPDATADALLAALARPAQVFHFAGHGVFTGEMGARYGSQEGESAVVLAADGGDGVAGGARLFPASRLAMTLTGRGVRLAVLTACEAGQRDAATAWAGVVTALTRVGIPAVVGMQFRILDASAVAFSRAFYRALAAGQTIDGAVADGRLAVFDSGGDDERDWGAPVLYLRAEDGVLFPRVPDAVGAGVDRTPSGGANAGPDRTTTPAARDDGSGGAASSSHGQEGRADAVDRSALRKKIVGAFRTEDLDLLCSDIESALAADGITLQVNLDMVGGGSKAVQVLRLIEYLDNRGHLPYLVAAVREQRPGLV